MRKNQLNFDGYVDQQLKNWFKVACAKKNSVDLNTTRFIVWCFDAQASYSAFARYGL